MRDIEYWVAKLWDGLGLFGCSSPEQLPFFLVLAWRVERGNAAESVAATQEKGAIGTAASASLRRMPGLSGADLLG